MAKHSEFILTPISGILEEAGTAVGNLQRGIESYPLKEYFLQSIFLKMTGAQEQKCKCILWDVATYDYVFRYQKFGARSDVKGECSSLKEKNVIYRSLLHLLDPTGSGSFPKEICDDDKRDSLIRSARTNVERFYQCCAVQGWPRKEYDEYETLCSRVVKTKVYLRGQLIEGAQQDANTISGKLAEDYVKSVYNHRNRCAHNLMSFQGNKPNFGLLRDEIKYWNYYYRFFLLVLVDAILSDVYNFWLMKMENGMWDEWGGNG